MLVPVQRAGHTPAADFTVLLSLVGGLLMWLVLAVYGLGRAQTRATDRLQREVAIMLASDLASTPAPTQDALSARIRPALKRLADSAGVRVLITANGAAPPSTRPLASGQAMVVGTPTSFVIEQAVEYPGLPMAPGMPQVLQALVVVALAATCMLGGLLLYRLQRQHEDTAQRSAFVRVVSHELRTPLAQILMFAETLRLGRTRTEQDRGVALGAIVQETRRLTRLVDNVLRFTRLEYGGLQLKQDVVHVRALVQETAAQFAPLTEGSGVAITVEAGPDAVAVGDKDALRQVLLNLLDNAIKYGPESQTIRTRIEQHEGAVRVIIEDEGPGVAMADAERIWHAFERGPVAHDTAAGTGLGLTIVRALTEAMGGVVHCEPRAVPQRGARFVVGLRALHPVGA